MVTFSLVFWSLYWCTLSTLFKIDFVKGGVHYFIFKSVFVVTFPAQFFPKAPEKSGVCFIDWCTYGYEAVCGREGERDRQTDRQTEKIGEEKEKER